MDLGLRIVTSTTHDVAARADSPSAYAIQVSGHSSSRPVKNVGTIGAPIVKSTSRQNNPTSVAFRRAIDP
jgi:hypothetical protein